MLLVKYLVATLLNNKVIDPKDINNVVQSNNTVKDGDIAGRDMYKNTFNEHNVNIYLSASKDYQSLISILHEATGVSHAVIHKLVCEADLTRSNHDFLEKSFSILFAAKNSLISDVFSDIKGEYEKTVLSNVTPHLEEEYLKNVTKTAGVYIAKMKFHKAHQLFGSALEEVPTDNPAYNLILKEYLITGFIHYSRTNDMKGLRSLISRKRSNLENEQSYIDYLIANIFQEVCSRDVNLNNLENAVATLEAIYNSANLEIKPSMANSLGLAYRRLGERTDIEYLEKAITMFDEGLILNTNDVTLEIQLKDQKAITYIRLFESTLNEVHLVKAEKLLQECLEQFQFMNDPRNFILKPRVLNNLGNVFKQKALKFKDIRSASTAITYYEDAEKLWTENDYGYEWSLLRKNIGETKFALGRISKDSDLLIAALEDCIASMKYRNLKNSPYQWAKSMDILFAIVVFLNKLNSIPKMPISIRKKIISYAKIINKNKVLWSKNNFPLLLENVQDALLILSPK